MGKNASHQSLFSPESSSKVARSTTEAGVDRTRIDKLSDQGKKLKLIATGEFHGIVGGGNDDFLHQLSYIFPYSKNVWLETICLIWKKVAPRHILYIEIIAKVRTVHTIRYAVPPALLYYLL